MCTHSTTTRPNLDGGLDLTPTTTTSGKDRTEYCDAGRPMREPDAGKDRTEYCDAGRLMREPDDDDDHHLHATTRQQGDTNNKKDKDAWDCRGQGGLWKRRHRGWRQQLFTPTRVPRGPSRGTELACCRRTEGEYEDGTLFTLVDNWCDSARAHLFLAKKWRGTTSFIGHPNPRLTGFSECRDLLSHAPVITVEQDNRGQGVQPQHVSDHSRDHRQVSFGEAEMQSR